MDSNACVSQFSRHVRCFKRCPEVDEESALVGFLLRAASEEGLKHWCLFPSTDEHVRILAQHWQLLRACYHLTIPPWDAVRHLYDKRLTDRLAEQQGVPTPETHCPDCLKDVVSLDLDYPIVLKPAISKRLMSVTRRKAYRANDQHEAIALYQMMASIIDPSEILVQELIPGRGENLYSYVGLFKYGTPVAGLSARRPRQHPMEFGRASTYVEVVDLPELETLAAQLLSGIAYSGLAEVEFMHDPKHNRFELLEVNPRIWGWHSITVRAGLDLPYYAYSDAVGRQFDVGSPRHGVKWIRLVTDVPTAVEEVLAGRLGLRQYLTSLRGDTQFAVLSLGDPLPFVADLLLGPYNYVKGRGF
jgi:predicted ATP-grasp superfamily ATP-dependent carboligase